MSAPSPNAGTSVRAKRLLSVLHSSELVRSVCSYRVRAGCSLFIDRVYPVENHVLSSCNRSLRGYAHCRCTLLSPVTVPHRFPEVNTLATRKRDNETQLDRTDTVITWLMFYTFNTGMVTTSVLQPPCHHFAPRSHICVLQRLHSHSDYRGTSFSHLRENMNVDGSHSLRCFL